MKYMKLLKVCLLYDNIYFGKQWILIPPSNPKSQTNKIIKGPDDMYSASYLKFKSKHKFGPNIMESMEYYYVFHAFKDISTNLGFNK